MSSILSINRRVLARSALAGAGLAMAYSYRTGAAASSGAVVYRTSTDASEDIHWMSATKLAQWIREGKVSSVEVVSAYIKRIQLVNPIINAVVNVCFERAMAEAKAADDRRARGEPLGPLHGVPMTIKDSFDTEGVISTGGTLGRANFRPERDATVVARCRAAGAILLGKTNTPEFTLGGGGVRGVGTTANIIFGLSRNAYDPRYTTGGSSGGAGAIVAAGGAAFDIGTDFGGSVRNPCHCSGIAGIKPQSGRASRTGHIVDYGGVFDFYQQPGPMARRMEDVELLLEIISGPDGIDAGLVPAPMGDPASISINGLKCAYFSNNGSSEADAETKKALMDAVEALRARGASFQEDTLPKMREQLELRSALRSADGNDMLRRLAEKWGSSVVSPSIAGRFTPQQEPASEVTRMLEEQDAYRSEGLKWIKNYDLVLCPVHAVPPFPFDQPQDGNQSFRSVFNLHGWPASVIRCGTSAAGLPIGIQLVAQPWREDVSMAAAKVVEAALGGYSPPRLEPISS